MIFLLIYLVISIFIHELAHLIVAKSVGCEVLKFSIGFGKPILFSKKIGNTVYQIAIWILGGFCELKGELSTTNEPDDFINLPYLKKLAIGLAGVSVNIILGAICFYFGINCESRMLYDFGLLNLILGITNALPLAPCLDGGYVVYLPLCFKIWGKEKGTKIFAIACNISFLIIMALNIICIPFAILMWRNV